jgi:hypothetical protein
VRQLKKKPRFSNLGPAANNRQPFWYKSRHGLLWLRKFGFKQLIYSPAPQLYFRWCFYIIVLIFQVIRCDCHFAMFPTVSINIRAHSHLLGGIRLNLCPLGMAALCKILVFCIACQHSSGLPHQHRMPQ